MTRDVSPLHLALLALLGAVGVWSAIDPFDPTIWVLEVFPAMIALVLITLSYKRFRLTNLLYVLITLHALILLVGGHYTYALVPAFDWLREPMGWSRNHFDRVGHFAQGFVPAMIARELLLRTSPLKSGKWLFAIITLSCLGISAAYELLEWGVAITAKESAEAFLAMQGDIWDTQKDMFLALCGAVLALLLLGKIHDKELKKIERL